MPVTVRVEGISELIRALRAVDRQLPREMTKANRAFAQSLVPSVQRAYSAKYTRREGRGVGSIRAVATQKTGGIRAGGARAPYMPGQEWGSNKYRRFAPSTGGEGRFMRPTIRAALPRLRNTYIREVLDPVLRLAFPRRGR